MQFKIYELKKMNMPFTIQFASEKFKENIEEVLEMVVRDIDFYLNDIENKFSVFKEDSYVSNHKGIGEDFSSIYFDKDYQSVYIESILAKKDTFGLFDAFFEKKYNPTGLVKGWAIEEAFTKYLKPLLDNNIVEGAALNGAGDMQVGISAKSDFSWSIGIENPFNLNEIVASYKISNGAVATSGFSKRGKHVKTENNIYQTTIVADSLKDSEIYATALLVAEESLVTQVIKEKKLTGMYIRENKEFIAFEKGEIVYVEKS